MRRYYTITLVAVFMIVSVIGITTGRSLRNNNLTTSSQAKPYAQSGITAISDGTTITVSGIPLGTAYVFGMSDGYDQYRVGTDGKTTMTLLVQRDHCNPITHVRVGEEVIAVQESQTTLTAGSFDCSKVTAIPVSECEALVDLYISTNGNNWKDNTGWLENSNPCSWYEVHCYGSNITRISLGGNNLTGTIPPGIDTLTKLENLDLSANNLTGQIPKEATSLVKIENLTLDSQNCVPLSLRFWFQEIANKNATYCPEPTPDRANFNIFEIEPVQVDTEGVKKVNVVAIEIFPTSPDNPNCLHAETGIPCNHSVKEHEDEIPKRITSLATFMNDASRYKKGEPYLDYQIVKRFRSYSRIPFGEQYTNSGKNTVFRPDYKTILSKIDFCALNDQYNIDEVWIYTYHDDRVGGIEPVETYQIGKYGENRSNGSIVTEQYKAPNCGNYTIFNMAYDQATSGNIGHDVHIRLHHIEATVGYLDPELF